MECRSKGCLAWVLVSEAEVRAFAETWPNFGPVCPLRFVFDTMTGKRLYSHSFESGHDAAGILVLAQKAKARAFKELEIKLSPKPARNFGLSRDLDRALEHDSEV